MSYVLHVWIVRERITDKVKKKWKNSIITVNSYVCKVAIQLFFAISRPPFICLGSYLVKIIKIKGENFWIFFRIFQNFWIFSVFRYFLTSFHLFHLKLGDNNKNKRRKFSNFFEIFLDFLESVEILAHEKIAKNGENSK